MLVGEGPGRMEDLRGVPFCGAAGKFLNELLRVAELRREDVYITNTVKCKPPGNRVPLDEEIEICTSNYLKKQFAIIKPKLVVALGRTSARALLNRDIVMAKEHGSVLDCTYAGVKFKLFLTYHPAAALYGAEAKEKLLADFKKLGQLVSKTT
jgi:DNA polymerase